MKKASIAIVSLLFILALVNTDVFFKERQIKTGKTVILALAPVDPRAIMQGDYMTLRYALSQDIQKALKGQEAQQGVAVLQLNAKQQGQFVRLYQGGPIKAQELLLYFRVRKGRVKIASEAFFFEEGKGALYATAKHALLRVGKSHKPLLVQLLDNNLQAIDASAIKR